MSAGEYSLRFIIMSKREKRLQRIRQNPNEVSFEELSLILEDFGFTYRKNSGSHRTFSCKIGDRTEAITIPYRRPIKPVYVKQALELIDEIILEGGGGT